MLQRAASNAYSWWWASHIRTKQSKWLDGNLQEMEERVKMMLKLIEEDADSFARRAEMYFKRRPELISVVEEAYRAYRALAERYDHISGELHKANHTIATAFPDQVQYAMLEEEDDNFPKAITPIDPGKINKPVIEGLVNKKKENRPSIRKAQQKKNTGQIDKEKAQEEINKLQKGILVLQTEKEFIKSSYESGIAKYWEIEKKIMEIQEDVFFFEDEFNASAVIEDDEARALMTTTALKSCEDAMVRLQEQREKSLKNVKAESERIKLAVEKLRLLKGGNSRSNMESVEVSNENSEAITFLSDMEEQAYSLNKEKVQLHTICEKVKEHIETNPDTSALEIAEDINELVNRIIELELTISSQTSHIDRLNSENNDLEKHLQSLEEEKTVLANDTDELTRRLKEAEDELSKVHIIEKSVRDEEKNFRANFAEFFNSLNDISEKMESPINAEGAHMMNPFLDDEESGFSPEPQGECEVKEATDVDDIMENLVEDIHMTEELSYLVDDSSRSEAVAQRECNSDSIQETDNEHESKDITTDKGSNQETPGEKDNFDMQKIVLNCPETKKTLSEVEQNNEDSLHEMTAVIRELKNVNAMKDEEIRMLRQELNFLKASSNKDAACGKDKDSGRGHRRLRSMSNFPTLMVSSNTKSSKLPPKPTLKSKGTRNKSVEAMDIGNTLPEVRTPKYIDEFNNVSPIEEKFRRDIDILLEENLEFWLQFSSSFHRVHEFQSKFDDVQANIDKSKDKGVQESSTSSSNDQISIVKPMPAVAQLRALKTELQVWLEQSQILRSELEARFSSLCSIQEEICGVINAGPENAEAKITPYQAAKYQGEVLNMQQENNKVASELQVGQDHVRALQAEIEKELSKLYSSFEPSSMPRTGNNNQFRNFPAKARVPLRAFLFNSKPKKPSIFACMNPNFLKQHADLRNRGFR